MESIFDASAMRSSGVVPPLPSIDDRFEGVAAVRSSMSLCFSIMEAICACSDFLLPIFTACSAMRLGLEICDSSVI